MAESSGVVVPKWDEKTSSLDSYEERVKRYVKGTKRDDRYLCANRLLARFDPDGLSYKTLVKAIPDERLEAPDGSGALMIAPTLRAGLGPKTMQEGVKLFRDLMTTNHLQRTTGESMKHWTARVREYFDKVGTALHAAEPEID